MEAIRVLAVAALLAACAFSGSRPSPSPQPAEADREPTPAPDPPEVAVEMPAQVEPDEALAWKVGHRVKNGDPPATTRALDIGHPPSDLQKAEAEWIAAQHTFEREKKLCEIDCMSRQFEAAEDAYRKARAKHERARDRAIHPHCAGAAALHVP